MAKQKIYEITKTVYGMARTRTYTLKGTLEELIEDGSSITIIGNIHENSALLEK
jgi:yopX protein